MALTLWFSAIYHMTQSKKGISSIELGRRLGVTQTTAWKIKQKLMQSMLERDAKLPLTGRVEMDDAYKRGRGAPGKTPFVAAVQTTAEGQPVRIKLCHDSIRTTQGNVSRSFLRSMLLKWRRRSDSIFHRKDPWLRLAVVGGCYGGGATSAIEVLP